PKVADTNVESFPLEAVEAPPGLMVGKTYHLTVSFIGSSFSLKAAEDDDIQALTKTSPYYHSRRGAFGVTLPKGSQIEFTKLRLRVLRRGGRRPPVSARARPRRPFRRGASASAPPGPRA